MTVHEIYQPLDTELPPVEPVDRDAAIGTMLALHWPEYATPDDHADAYYGTFPRLSDAKMDYPVPFAARSIHDEWTEFPYELRREDVESDKARCHQLAEVVCRGPFAAANAKVAEAVRLSLHDAVDQLYQEFMHQNNAQSYQEMATFDYDAGIALQVMNYSLAGLAVKLGALDHQDAYAEYMLLSLPGVASHSRTRDGAYENTYQVVSHDVLEIPDDDVQEVESPGQLTIRSIPRARFDVSLDFASSGLATRFQSQTIQDGREVDFPNFSIRIDYDEKSPTGFSLDVGRDERHNDRFVRSADPVGRSLQAGRTEGSHFTDRFEGITAADMEAFLSGMGEFLDADARMSMLDAHYKNRIGLNTPRKSKL